MMVKIEKIRSLLNSENLDSLLILSWPNIFWLTDYNGFSREENEAIILVTKKSSYLITDARYEDEVSELSQFKCLITTPEKDKTDLIKNIVKKENLRKTGFEEDTVTVSQYTKLKKVFNLLTPLSQLVNNMRAIKNSTEIKKIENACKIGDKTFSYIIKQLKLGVSEIEIQTKIEIFIKKQGFNASFRPIVAFGKNAAIPHHLNSKQKLKNGDLVLLDFGVNYEGYCSDMTRTVFFGKPDSKKREIYQTVLSAQREAAEKVKTGALASDIDEVAREYIKSNGFPNIIHSVGHGIGVEVHESPHLSPGSEDIVEEGMIFSIEPGIYLKNEIGVRIEDLFLVTHEGSKKLTLSSTEVIVL